MFQETVAETLRPLAEGTEHHEEGLTCAAGVCHNTFEDCEIIYSEEKTYFQHTNPF